MFLHNTYNNEMIIDLLDEFCQLDDYDVVSSIKAWSSHKDKVLSLLCKSLLNRNLLKCRLQTNPLDEEIIADKRKTSARELNISVNEAAYFVFTGEAVNTTYALGDEHIKILFRDQTVRDISNVDDPLIHQTLSTPVKKFYICELTI
jgi:hypothetical protein